MDFDRYNVYEPVRGFEHRQYLEDLIQEKRVNKGKIKKSMMNLVYLQLIDRVSAEFPSLPGIFAHNKHQWSVLLLKSPAFQSLLTDFTGRFAHLIEKEVTKNRQQLGLYLTHPRIPGG